MQEQLASYEQQMADILASASWICCISQLPAMSSIIVIDNDEQTTVSYAFVSQ